jgi:hypothetical protein
MAMVGLTVRVRFRERLSRRRASAAAAAVFAVWVTALTMLLPARTDPVNTPVRLLWEFRAAPHTGRVLFWVLFSGLFASLLARGETTPALASTRPG